MDHTMSRKCVYDCRPIRYEILRYSTIYYIKTALVLLKELFKIYFYFTAAGVVPCGSRKKPPRTSSIVQDIFYFSILRSEEIF